MTDVSRIVVVGGGLTGATTCETLRQRGYDGHLTVIGAERHLPYERPPLSKGYLMGNDELETVFAHPQEWYDANDVDLHLGSTATNLDLAKRTVATSLGESVSFDRLLIATGSTAKRMPIADESGARVVYLRTIEDSQSIKATLVPGHRLAIIGAGWIGLEVAAAARAADCDVTVLEAADQPLVRVLGPEMGQYFATLHRDHGVDLRTDVTVKAVGSVGDRALIELGDGSSVSADTVLVGIGVVPNSDLASDAGLDVDNGILLDAQLRSSDPDVLAAGDVANTFTPRLGRHLRVEHWDNAIEQGRAAAGTMLGDEQPYDHLPYFFTDQYDLGMEYVGHVDQDGYDELVVRGDLGEGVFTAFWVKDGRVSAGMQVNDWDATDHIKRLVTASAADLSRLRDTGVPLDEQAR